MRLIKARIKGYRSIKDTGYFDIEKMKTIMVGPNESGKTAILQALQKLNPPNGVSSFNPLRDYPRSGYDTDIAHNGIDQSKFTVVEGHFELNDEDKEKMPVGFKDIIFVFGKCLSNDTWCRIDGGIDYPTYADIEKDMIRLLTHIDSTYSIQNSSETASPGVTPSESIKKVIEPIKSDEKINGTLAKKLINWLKQNLKYVDEGNEKEEQRLDKIISIVNKTLVRDEALSICKSLLPKFILFNNYFRIKPSIHLRKLAERTERNLLDDEQYDYGNNCLLKYLGFTARDLSNAGDTSKLNLNDSAQFEKYKSQLDERNYAINAATIRLTNAIVGVWNPKNNKKDVNKLRITTDGQYMKVVVEDELGVEVELDQRSEGFQWLVSFFIVFFSEADDKHENAILLLDEPGLSLHALKQVEFQETITKLCEKNQTIFTTHSPFLVGADELDKVRVIEMLDRIVGTRVNTSVTATDRGALLPLQEALGYDLAQSLFFHKKNLILEGLTDYWFIEGASKLLKESEGTGLDERIALLPANCASKVVYYATIMHAQNLNVAALLDSDAEGDLAAKQDNLVNALGNKRILRTKDAYSGAVKEPEIEDLFRDTLISIAKEKFSLDVTQQATKQKSRPIANILYEVSEKNFSKYRLAKAFLRWSSEHTFKELTSEEQMNVRTLVNLINKALK